VKKELLEKMLDPFFPPAAALIRAVQPICDAVSLSTLPQHAHEVLIGWASYHLLYTVFSPLFSAWLFPKVYARLPARTKVNWDVRVVSTIQALFIVAAALYVIWADHERAEMDWRGRVWGYTGAGGMVQGFAAGYFLWDLGVSLSYVGVLGWGSLAHAISALLVTSLGFVSVLSFAQMLRPARAFVEGNLADLWVQASVRKLLRAELRLVRAFDPFP
jgi:hypothetical protein